MLWQAILYADGKFWDKSELDGYFGGRTYYATRSWQSSKGIGVDGWVGPQTWRTANEKLRWWGNKYVVYDGTKADIYFYRGYSYRGAGYEQDGGHYRIAKIAHRYAGQGWTYFKSNSGSRLYEWRRSTWRR